MKTIIIPTDYSVNATNAAHYGAALASTFDAKVILFHAFHLSEAIHEITVPVLSLEEIIAQHIAQLEKLGQELKLLYPIHIAYAAKLGFCWEELSQLLADQPDSLVVMGMRGANQLEQKVFGTLTTLALRNASFPVLAVPAEARMEPIRHILFACDSASLTLDNSLEWLRQIASYSEAKVQILHIAKPDTVLADGSLTVEGAQLEQLLEGVEYEYAWVEEESVSQGIKEGIHSYHADLLVMVPRRRNFWDVITGQSETHKMAFQTHIPLLALPNPVAEA